SSDLSDYVIRPASATPETRHLIGARELGLVKDAAALINIARGSVVDEQALITALQEGTSAGAGLDVFEVEPLPGDSPLIGLENEVLAPHSLCWTQDLTDSTAAEMRGEGSPMAAGQPPRNG